MNTHLYIHLPADGECPVDTDSNRGRLHLPGRTFPAVGPILAGAWEGCLRPGSIIIRVTWYRLKTTGGEGGKKGKKAACSENICGARSCSHRWMIESLPFFYIKSFKNALRILHMRNGTTHCTCHYMNGLLGNEIQIS